MSRTRLFTVAALAAALGLLLGCGSEENTTDNVFPSFVRAPSERAVVPSGTAGWPSIAADPSIVSDAEGYHLFYTAFFCRKPDGSYSYTWDPQAFGTCDLGQAWGATAYAFSRDRGLSWEFRATPVVAPGTAEWNDKDIETPFVCRVGDRLCLFYCALGSRGGAALHYRYQLGAATLDLGGRSIRETLLSTGETFIHHQDPLVEANLVERHGVNNSQEPSVVVRDGQLELYFVSLGLALPDQDIFAPGQEVSVALRRAVFGADFSLIEPPSAPLLTGAVANIPEVRYFDDRYHLFATTTELDDHEDDKITYASSQDGHHFTAPATILSRRGGDVFDNWGLMAPTLVVEPESVVLFYTGWEMQARVCRLTGPDGRMGMSQESRPEAARCLYAALGRAVSIR